MNNFKQGFKMMGSIIMAATISFFLCISINIICSAIFTTETGYTAYVYETETSSEPITEYEYTYNDTDGDGTDDGIDIQKKEYEDKGYNVVIQKQRSELIGVGKAVFLLVSQILSLIMLIAFASSGVYKQGFKDSNLVRIGHSKRDMLKGFKIGLIANIPFFVLFTLAIVMAVGLAPKFSTVWYAFLNSHYYSAIKGIVGTAKSLSQLNVWQYIVLFLLQFIVPIISGIAYILGFKEINLAEKIVYKRGEI